VTYVIVVRAYSFAAFLVNLKKLRDGRSPISVPTRQTTSAEEEGGGGWRGMTAAEIGGDGA
jgi:hypothetical protein